MEEHKLYFPTPVKPIKSTIVIDRLDGNDNLINFHHTVYYVNVNGENYEKAVQSSTNMYANTKTGHYGRGMINRPDDPRRVERIGRLGEIALAKAMNCGVDLNYLENGDTCDIEYKDHKIDVKTSERLPEYYCGLIRATTNDAAKILKLKSDIYYFAFLWSEDRVNKTALIGLLGAINKKAITISRKNMHPARNRYAKHLNYEIPYENLKHFRMFEQ